MPLNHGTSMLEQQLVRKINLERCFALVGSGPSSEVGYPTWEDLAIGVFKELVMRGAIRDTSSYDKYLRSKQFPELFRQAERDLGNRLLLIEIVKTLMVPTVRRRGHIYDYLVRWPFACYLTTNYDDELEVRLKNEGLYYEVKRNRIEDLYVLRDNASNYIIKLHSDLDHPNEVVLTSTDYARLTSGDEGKYFRDKLRAVMEMFDICIVGHSLADPDLSLILQTARETASPEHPIFMLAANFTLAEQQEYLEKYNIRVTSYSNNDGSHIQLRRMLSVADRFVVSREDRSESRLPNHISADEYEAASALLVFRRLRKMQHEGETKPSDYLSPIVLRALASTVGRVIEAKAILSVEPIRAISGSADEMLAAVTSSLHILLEEGLVSETAGHYQISALGTKHLSELSALRSSEENLAFGQFIVSLKQAYPTLSQDQETEACALLRDTIVSVFRTRGIAIANAVFGQQSVRPDELSDIFAAVSNAAGFLDHPDLRSAFVDAAHELIVAPSGPQKTYFASISQGYFLYHMLGLDPAGVRVRLTAFRNTIWLCDSNILLPLLAPGCYNHDYASDLFESLRGLTSQLYTTDKLVQEVYDHLSWARRLVNVELSDSLMFLSAAMGKLSYRSNVFIDAYIRLAADGSVGTFQDYLDLIGISEPSQQALEVALDKQGITILRLSELQGFQVDDWGELIPISDAIETERRTRGTYRSEAQVTAEAEVIQIIVGIRQGNYQLPNLQHPIERTYFLSQSQVLDRATGGSNNRVTTWTPEALYRYLITLPGMEPDPDLLQQCLLSEYYYVGEAIIDSRKYRKFFGPAVSGARLSFSDQKNKYLEDAEDQYRTRLEESFEDTPDLEKPFFVQQMTYAIVARAEAKAKEAVHRAFQAEMLAGKLMQDSDELKRIKLHRRKTHQEQTERNLRNPKHRAKKLRQQKDRQRKQKKKR